MHTRVGFTGTQRGVTTAQKRAVQSLLFLLVEAGSTHFHHGDCIGADEEVAYVARALGFWIVGHPPIAKLKRAFFPSDEVTEPKAYLVRNKDIVKDTSALIVVPREMTEVLRSGTWSTYRYAKQQNKHIYLINPKGHTEEFNAPQGLNI